MTPAEQCALLAEATMGDLRSNLQAGLSTVVLGRGDAKPIVLPITPGSTQKDVLRTFYKLAFFAGLQGWAPEAVFGFPSRSKQRSAFLFFHLDFKTGECLAAAACEFHGRGSEIEVGEPCSSGGRHSGHMVEAALRGYRDGLEHQGMLEFAKAEDVRLEEQEMHGLVDEVIGRMLAGETAVDAFEDVLKGRVDMKDAFKALDLAESLSLEQLADLDGTRPFARDA